MKNNLILLCSVTLLLAACAKTKHIPSPGAKPDLVGETTKRTEPPQNVPVPVIPAPVAEQPAPAPVSSSGKLVGSWESECVQEDSQSYHSYRTELLIFENDMYEQLFRFEDAACANLNTSIADGYVQEWKFTVEAEGAREGSPWTLLYTEYNWETLSEPSVGTIDMTRTGGRDAIDQIQFDGAGLKYKRLK